MVVVDGKEWESLKRYNVNELYRAAREDAKKATDGEKKQEQHHEEVDRKA
jgi:hypothetical protein